jgi:hypothetical protein
MGQKYGTGSGTAAVLIPPGNGLIVGRRGWYTSAAAGTLVVYPARFAMVANAAVSAATTLVVKTDASGYIGGAVISTSDMILVFNTTTKAWVYSTISSVAAVSSSTVSLGLGSAISITAGGTVYLVRAADIVTLTTGTETVKDLDYWFTGVQAGMPVYLLLTATGTDLLSTVYEYQLFD